MPARTGESPNVTISSTRSPRSTRDTFMRLFRNSPADTSSAMDSAICTVTSVARNRVAALPPVSCPAPARITLIKSDRVLCSAGKSPNTRPVTTASAAVNSTTLPWSSSPSAPTSLDGMSVPMNLSVRCATPRLATPPISASSTDSVSSSASSCLRVAPSARRTPISAARPAPRASSRLAMFAHAISSTTPVTPINSSSGVFALSGMLLCPCRPSFTVTRRALKRASVWLLIPLCSGTSTSLMIGR